ncbi:hypothetical protein AgCh_038815 [Apium graveolens]
MIVSQGKALMQEQREIVKKAGKRMESLDVTTPSSEAMYKAEYQAILDSVNLDTSTFQHPNPAPTSSLDDNKKGEKLVVQEIENASNVLSSSTTVTSFTSPQQQQIQVFVRKEEEIKAIDKWETIYTFPGHEGNGEAKTEEFVRTALKKTEGGKKCETEDVFTEHQLQLVKELEKELDEKLEAETKVEGVKKPKRELIELENVKLPTFLVEKKAKKKKELKTRKAKKKKELKKPQPKPPVLKFVKSPEDKES